MGLRLAFGSVVVAATLGVTNVASAADVQSACPGEEINDGLSQLTQAVDQAARASISFARTSKQLTLSGMDAYETPSFQGTGTGDAPASTTYDIKAAHETEGKIGVVPTVAWTDAEQKEISAVENKLPLCVANASNIQDQYRVQRGLKSSASGILGVAYMYNNQNGKNAGRLLMTDLMMNGQVYKGLTADQQMQAAVGFRACYPPSGDANNIDNVRGRLAAMPPQIKKLTRERILFHEYIHGVTHQQEGEDYSNNASTEGFWSKPSTMCPKCGASRFDALRAKLFAPDLSTPESQHLADLKTKLTTITNGPDARAQYCAAYKEMSDYMAAQGVPQRWPGDLHSLDDKDEYITILIENAAYDPTSVFGPQSVYSPAEQQWVKDWWKSTFGSDKIGSCASDLVAQGGKPSLGTKSAISNAYSSATDPYFQAGWFGGF